jgi:hypothetical protein
VERAGRRSSQSASDELQSCHETIKGSRYIPCIWSARQGQVRTHHPDQPKNHGQNRNIGKVSKIKQNNTIQNKTKQRSMDD